MSTPTPTPIFMEQDPADIVLHFPNPTTDPPHVEPSPTQQPRKEKRRGAMHILRVALFMMRRRRSDKSKPVYVDDGSRSLWRKLVGSMRPLHLQRNESPPPSLQSTKEPLPLLTVHSSPSHTDFSEDTLFSPSGSPIADLEGSQHSRSAPSSRYASAVGLNELDLSEENEEEIGEEECKENYKDGEGDEMIDAKAEEFIANFYYQIRLQRLNSMDPRYREISERSLG